MQDLLKNWLKKKSLRNRPLSLERKRGSNQQQIAKRWVNLEQIVVDRGGTTGHTNYSRCGDIKRWDHRSATHNTEVERTPEKANSESLCCWEAEQGYWSALDCVQSSALIMIFKAKQLRERLKYGISKPVKGKEGIKPDQYEWVAGNKLEGEKE